MSNERTVGHTSEPAMSPGAALLNAPPSRAGPTGREATVRNPGTVTRESQCPATKTQHSQKKKKNQQSRAVGDKGEEGGQCPATKTQHNQTKKEPTSRRIKEKKEAGRKLILFELNYICLVFLMHQNLATRRYLFQFSYPV